MPASQASVKAGSAYMTLFAEDGALRATLDANARRMKAFGAALIAIGKGTLGVARDLASPFQKSAIYFADAGNALQKMSERTGASVEALSQLGFAAEQSGGSIEDIEHSLKFMSKTIAEASKGGEDASLALHALGTTADALKKMSPEEGLAKLADGVAKIQNPALRTAATLAVFGRGSAGLVALLAKGSAGIADLRHEADRLGLTISGDSALGAAELHDTWLKITSVFNAATYAVGGALSPTLQKLSLQILDNLVMVRQWVADNQGIVLTAAKGVIALGALGAGLVVLGVAASAVGSGLAFLSSTIGAVGAGFAKTWAFLQTPLGRFTAARYALTALWLGFTEDGRRAYADIATAWSQFAGGIVTDFDTSWGAILKSLQAGDLGLAFEIALANVRVAWQRGLVALEESWKAFQDNIGKTLQKPEVQGGGVVAGAAAGGYYGGRVAGPYGVLAGAAIGGIAGHGVTNPSKARDWAGYGWSWLSYAGGIGGELYADAAREIPWLPGAGGGGGVRPNTGHGGGGFVGPQQLSAAEEELRRLIKLRDDALAKPPSAGAESEIDQLRAAVAKAKDQVEQLNAAMHNITATDVGFDMEGAFEGRLHAMGAEAYQANENLKMVQAQLDKKLGKKAAIPNDAWEGLGLGGSAGTFSGSSASLSLGVGSPLKTMEEELKKANGQLSDIRRVVENMVVQ